MSKRNLNSRDGKSGRSEIYLCYFFPAGANFWHMHVPWAIWCRYQCYQHWPLVVLAPFYALWHHFINTSGAISTRGACSITSASSTTGASRIGKCHNLHCFVANWKFLSFTMFCRKLENVVIYAFLVLIFWGQICICAIKLAFPISVLNIRKFPSPY